MLWSVLQGGYNFYFHLKGETTEAQRDEVTLLTSSHLTDHPAFPALLWGSLTLLASWVTRTSFQNSWSLFWEMKVDTASILSSRIRALQSQVLLLCSQGGLLLLSLGSLLSTTDALHVTASVSSLLLLFVLCGQNLPFQPDSPRKGSGHACLIHGHVFRASPAWPVTTWAFHAKFINKWSLSKQSSYLTDMSSTSSLA